MELLNMLKNTIGDLSTSNDLDGYYQAMLDQAIADLATDDISTTILATEIGKVATVLYSKLLINNEDISTNSTLNNLRNKLSSMTKAERNTL